MGVKENRKLVEAVLRQATNKTRIAKHISCVCDQSGSGKGRGGR